MNTDFYSLISNFSYVESDRVKFVLTRDLIIEIPSYDFGQAVYVDQKGTVRLVARGSTLTVFCRYGWDGCSPKFSFLNYWIGTPDPKETILASLIHDALSQFLHLSCMKVDKGDVDLIFFGIMKQNRAKVANLYYQAVSKFGWIYRAFGAINRPVSECYGPLRMKDSSPELKS